MLSYIKLVRPDTIEEAHAAFVKNKMAIFLAGGCWTRLGKRAWPMVIDLSGLNLRYVKEEEDHYAIGAMATQWDVETFAPFQTFANGLVAKCVHPILGVQFRNSATMGGSIAGRFGFSDIIPTFVALEAQVVLVENGVKSLKEYLAKPVRDLLTEIRIPKQNIPVAMESMRKSASDFPFLTGSINKLEDGYHIYVGCRPSPLAEAVEASRILTEQGEAALEQVGAKAAEEIALQSNSHATAEYRRAMVPGLVKRMAKEVLQWK